MSLITTLENRLVEDYKANCLINLLIQKHLLEKHFKWLTSEITGNVLSGKGTLIINSKKYQVKFYYSPFFERRNDRIYLKNDKIVYHRDIHLYGDMSLCLYHPRIDKPLLKIITLYDIVPWITEWCIHYKEWKKYGVWLGKEIKH